MKTTKIESGAAPREETRDVKKASQICCVGRCEIAAPSAPSDALRKVLEMIRADMTPANIQYESHYLRQFIVAWATKIDAALTASPSESREQELRDENTRHVEELRGVVAAAPKEPQRPSMFPHIIADALAAETAPLHEKIASLEKQLEQKASGTCGLCLAAINGAPPAQMQQGPHSPYSPPPPWAPAHCPTCDSPKPGDYNGPHGPQEQLGKEDVGAAPPTADELGKLLDRAAPGADYLAASLRGQFPMRTESAGAAPEGLVLAGPADLEQQLIGALQALQLSERRRNGASLSGEVNEHEDLELDLVRDPGDSHRMLRCKACQVDGPFAIALSDNGQWNLECVNCCETAAILTEVLAKLR